MTTIFPQKFKSLSKNVNDLNFSCIFKNNPRNFLILISNKKNNNNLFVLKQAKIQSVNSLEPFENEVSYFQVFSKVGVDFYYNSEKKYLILPWIANDFLNNAKFFESKKYNKPFCDSVICLTYQAIADFHKKSNLLPAKKKFLKKSYSSMKPVYLSFLRAFKKAYCSRNFESVFFINNENKNVKTCVVNFFNQQKVSDFLIDLFYEKKFNYNQLIHGDLSIDNLRGTTDSQTLTVIDFEFICLGDPFWDYIVFIESIFAQFFSRVYAGIEEARFTFMTSFLKNIYNVQSLSGHKPDLIKFTNLLIIYKCRCLINLCNSNIFIKPENNAKIIIKSITALINNFNEFIDLITDKSKYSESSDKFFISSSFDLD